MPLDKLLNKSCRIRLDCEFAFSLAVVTQFKDCIIFQCVDFSKFLPLGYFQVFPIVDNGDEQAFSNSLFTSNYVFRVTSWGGITMAKYMSTMEVLCTSAKYVSMDAVQIYTFIY